MSKVQVKKQFAANFTKAVAESEYKNLKPLKAIGRVFGVSGTMVHNWAAGKKMPAMAQGVIIALKLGVNVEWLLTNRGPMRIQEGISYQGATLLSAFEGMTDGAKREILGNYIDDSR